jgi:hypothetical protein
VAGNVIKFIFFGLDDDEAGLFTFYFSCTAEYAAVGYIAKRIEMRKKRYQNLQKLAEQRRAAMQASSNAGSGGLDGETASSTVAKSHVRKFGNFKKKKREKNLKFNCLKF